MPQISSFVNAACFALYRMPGKGEVHAVCADRAEVMENGCEGVGGHGGFFIAPFDKESLPALLIPALKTGRFYGANLPNVPKQLSGYEESDRTRYMQDFAAVKQALEKNSCMKLVLARRVRLRLVAYSFDPLVVFGAACKAYPHNYIAMWHTPQTGTWITATPELLLSRTADNRCRTMALAGTMPASVPQARKLEGWSQKNIEEQSLVAQHIYRVLFDAGISYRLSRLRIQPSGDLLHLRTGFTFPSPASPSRLLDSLHPTPAVCGMPVRSAKEVLASTEHIQRDYYAGYTGPIHPDGTFAFYVTLRCLRQVDQGCDLYAGSGIMPQSTAEEEWQETEHKLNALRRLMPLYG